MGGKQKVKHEKREERKTWRAEWEKSKNTDLERVASRIRHVVEEKRHKKLKARKAGEIEGQVVFLRAIREKHKYFQSVFSQGLNRFHRVFIAAPF